MRELIFNWYNINDGHPLDDRRFYDIVIESVENKIELSTFEDALRDVNEHLSDEEIRDVYSRYEDLRCLLNYYNSQQTV